MISVVILNFNGKNFLSKCLDSVFKSDYPNFEVILVDNGSTDGSIEYARNSSPQNRKTRTGKQHSSIHILKSQKSPKHQNKPKTN